MQRKIVGHYSLDKYIGSGQYSEVYQGKNL
jgi:serine/threonine protein kinase